MVLGVKELSFGGCEELGIGETEHSNGALQLRDQRQCLAAPYPVQLFVLGGEDVLAVARERIDESQYRRERRASVARREHVRCGSHVQHTRPLNDAAKLRL